MRKNVENSLILQFFNTAETQKTHKISPKTPAPPDGRSEVDQLRAHDGRNAPRSGGILPVEILVGISTMYSIMMFKSVGIQKNSDSCSYHG